MAWPGLGLTGWAEGRGRSINLRTYGSRAFRPTIDAQKPSNARPTQLKANRPQAATATEANVAIAFVEGMTAPFCMTVTLCSVMSAQKWQEHARPKLRAVVAVLQHHPDPARKNP
jgi:hypothetical protein